MVPRIRGLPRRRSPLRWKTWRTSYQSSADLSTKLQYLRTYQTISSRTLKYSTVKFLEICITWMLQAEDPDTVKKITYVIHQGPTDLFRIDENSGAVYTIRGLDFEKESQHILTIGTLENMSNQEGSTTKVIVNVEDRNDIPPVFTIIPHPITLEDDVAIGTPVTTLVATDSDGTAPGNKVRYEIIGRGKAAKYFQIDPDAGVLKVTNDLKKEIDTEYQVLSPQLAVPQRIEFWF